MVNRLSYFISRSLLSMVMVSGLVALSAESNKGSIRYVGHALTEVEKELGGGIVRRDKLEDDCDLIIYTDRNAELAAIANHDTSLNIYGWEFVVDKGLIVRQMPIYGMIMANNGKPLLPGTVIAGLYTLTAGATDALVKGAPVAKIGGLDYYIAPSMASCSALVKGIIVVRNPNSAKLMDLRLRCDIQDIRELMDFSSQVKGLEILLIINEVPICVGSVRYIVESGELEIQTGEVPNILGILKSAGADPVGAGGKGQAE